MRRGGGRKGIPSRPGQIYAMGLDGRDKILFLVETPLKIYKLRKALEAGNFASAVWYANSIKTAAHGNSARKLGSTARRIEGLIESDSLEHVLELTRLLETEFAAYRDADLSRF
jgi:HPt (histidine-containing phosphotransfer) domain-containing protein